MAKNNNPVVSILQVSFNRVPGTDPKDLQQAVEDGLEASFVDDKIEYRIVTAAVESIDDDSTSGSGSVGVEVTVYRSILGSESKDVTPTAQNILPAVTRTIDSALESMPDDNVIEWTIDDIDYPEAQ